MLFLYLLRLNLVSKSIFMPPRLAFNRLVLSSNLRRPIFQSFHSGLDPCSGSRFQSSSHDCEQGQMRSEMDRRRPFFEPLKPGWISGWCLISSALR